MNKTYVQILRLHLVVRVRLFGRWGFLLLCVWGLFFLWLGAWVLLLGLRWLGCLLRSATCTQTCKHGYGTALFESDRLSWYHPPYLSLHLIFSVPVQMKKEKKVLEQGWNLRAFVTNRSLFSLPLSRTTFLFTSDTVVLSHNSKFLLKPFLFISAYSELHQLTHQHWMLYMYFFSFPQAAVFTDD